MPKVHLRGFANKGELYVNNLFDSNSTPNRRYGLSGICFEQNLYEVRDVNGEFINCNCTENALELVETKYGPVKQKILSQLHNEKIILSSSDMGALDNMVTTLLVRNHDAFLESRNILSDVVVGRLKNITREEAVVIAQSLLLPQQTASNKCSFDYSLFTNLFRQQLEGLSLVVGISNNLSFITGDVPIWNIVSGEDENGWPILSVLGYPITPNVILYFTEKKYDNIVCRQVTDEDVITSNLNIARKANKYILSLSPVEESMLHIYKQAYIDARQDVTLRYTSTPPTLLTNE